jgi:hypothetical protein
MQGKLFFTGRFFYRAPWKMRTAKLLFVVRTAKIETHDNHRFSCSGTL